MTYDEELHIDIDKFIEEDPLAEEKKNFDRLSNDDKLSRLNHLVQQSQVYSQIILDNMLEKSLAKKQLREQQEKEREQREKDLANGISVDEIETKSESPKEKEQHTIQKRHFEKQKIRPRSFRLEKNKVVEVELSDPDDIINDSDEDSENSNDSDDDSDIHVEEQVLGSDSDLEIVKIKTVSKRGTKNSQRVTRPLRKRKHGEVHVPKKKPKKKSSKKTEMTRKALEDAQTGHNQHQPRLVSGCVMKDYQLDGLEWLVTLYENGLNGILADEMGLGKTLQCISLICYLIEHGVKGPFLIVAPLSTVPNWCQEFKKFAPKVKVLQYIGTKEKRHDMLLGKRMRASVVVTSYELIIRDYRRFCRTRWQYMTVDEGHRLKNFECILVQFLKKLNVANRLLLTGTPLQNNLKELWSLLNFILPDIFQDLALFELWFDFDEIAEFGDASHEEKRMLKMNMQQLLIKNLHSILKPFLLRRLKRDVIKDLPPKKEYIIYSSLSPLQRVLYNSVMTGILPAAIFELYLKEYMLVNHRSLFNSEEDLQTIDKFLHERRVATGQIPIGRPEGEKRQRTAIYTSKELRRFENSNERELNKDLWVPSPELQPKVFDWRTDTGIPEQVLPPAAVPNNPFGAQLLTQRELDEEVRNQTFELERAILLEMNELTDAPEPNGKELSYAPVVDMLSIVENGQKNGLVDEPAEKAATPIIEVADGALYTDLEDEAPKRKRRQVAELDSEVIAIESDEEVEVTREDKQRRKLFLRADKIGMHVQHLHLHNMVMQLRNTCGSHYTYYDPYPDDDNDHIFVEKILMHSGKMQTLKQLMVRLLNDKHKVLVFSQFTKVLDIIAIWLNDIEVPFSRLDGRMQQDVRQEEIADFSSDAEDSSKVFLLSTRAGGLGLNLVSADTVILFDNDWNPQIDLQAIDRVHRIGQTKPVKIFRFVVRNTVEELLIMRSFNKRLLEKMVIQLGEFQLGKVAKKLADEKIDISTFKSIKAIMDLGSRLNLYSEVDPGYTMEHANRWLMLTEKPKDLLTTEEMDELMDRSAECYTREILNFDNVTAFETTNNMDGSEE